MAFATISLPFLTNLHDGDDNDHDHDHRADHSDGDHDHDHGHVENMRNDKVGEHFNAVHIFPLAFVISLPSPTMMMMIVVMMMMMMRMIDLQRYSTRPLIGSQLPVCRHSHLPNTICLSDDDDDDDYDKNMMMMMVMLLLMVMVNDDDDDVMMII